jgi:uncharacterized lipoprotein NlpE involved in copper resistance
MERPTRSLVITTILLVCALFLVGCGNENQETTIDTSSVTSGSTDNP